jgi:hypothetical protein
LSILLFCIVGCSVNNESHPRLHEQFFQEYGWEINQFLSSKDYGQGVLSVDKDFMKEVLINGKIDLAPYKDKAVLVTEYRLDPTVGVFNKITGYVFQSEGKVIGGYLMLNQELLEGSIYTTIEGQSLPMMKFDEVKKRLNP